MVKIRAEAVNGSVTAECEVEVPQILDGLDENRREEAEDEVITQLVNEVAGGVRAVASWIGEQYKREKEYILFAIHDSLYEQE